MLMRMDYNNFVRLVDEAFGEREDLNTYAIEVGFDILTAYLRRFAEIAIKRNDAELLELCKNLCIIKESEEEAARNIAEGYRDLLDEISVSYAIQVPDERATPPEN